MKPAHLEFTEDGTPKSVDFGDVYFSEGHGIAETHYVFLEQNDLPNRFSHLNINDHFTIAETGFGTGLNFLVASQCFLKHAPDSARLTFISCEKYPIAVEDLIKAHGHWPQLAEHSAALRQQYPPALEGFHLLSFGRISLLLMLGDASEVYSQLTAKVDAWFLDGFAPSKNPDMWQPELFQQLQRLSHTSTTFATFTAARLVRDGLRGSGFQFEKVAGFGKKRHMLKGSFIGLLGPSRPLAWPSAELANPRPNKDKRVAIIGAGIAGITTARELVARGYQVEIFERESAAAMGGSGNDQGAVYAKLSAHQTHSNQFYAQALIMAQNKLGELPDNISHEQCGLVQLAQNTKETQRLNSLENIDLLPGTLAQVQSAQWLTETLGVTVSAPGLWFPNGGWASPKEWVQHLLNELTQTESVKCHFDFNVESVELNCDGWSLRNAKGDAFSFDQVVIASAFHTRKFKPTQHLPLNPIAGQITQLTATPKHLKLKAVICTDRYVMPVHNEKLTVGSTFRVKSDETDVREAEHLENLKNLHERVPELVSESDQIAGGRAALRCNSPDYLPLIGAISQQEDLQRYKIPIQKNLSHRQPPAPHLPGLWVNVAHGSKGLCSSHLGAKLLAAMISGEPYPLQADIVKALNPNRFTVRQLKREARG